MLGIGTNRLFVYGAVAAVAAFAGFGAVYATLGGGDNRAVSLVSDSANPPAAMPVASAATGSGEGALPKGPGKNPLSTGHMAAFVFKAAPEQLPEITFTDGQGAPKSLADWRGKVVLLNLWATWCAPCRKEMPALDRLQAELGSDRFEVVALSVDRTGVDGAKKFLDQIKVEKLGVYADGTARAGSALKAIGMPTTLLIDAEGREIGRLIGPAEWDSAEAKTLISAAMR